MDRRAVIERDVRLVTEREHGPRPPSPRNWWFLLLALGLVGVLALVLATPASPAPEPISPGTSLPEVGSTDPEQADIRTGWQQIPLPGAGRLVDIESTAVGVVAVGQGLAGDGFVWSSPDGTAWEYRATIPRSRLTAVAADPTGAVVVGAERFDESLPYWDPGGARPFVWWSVDGSTWQGSLLEVAGDNAGEAIGVVVDQSGRLVAYGWEAKPGAVTAYAFRQPLSIPAVWHSDGGRAWERAALPAEQGAWIADATVTRSGFVAVGSHGDEPALWTSVDGLAWQAQSLEGVGGDWELGSIAELPGGGYLALLTRRDSSDVPYITSLWRSEDLLVWEAVEATGIFSQIGFSDLETLGSRVFGTVRPDRERQVFSGPEIWFTEDGEKWRAVVSSATSGLLPGSFDAEVLGVASMDEGLIAVGYHNSQPMAWAHERQEVPAVRLPPVPVGEGQWITRTVIADLNEPPFLRVWRVGGRLVTSIDDQVWLSDDGLAWTPTGSAPAIPSWRLVGVVDGGPGMVAFGQVRNGAPGLSLSEDGWRWEEIDLTPLSSLGQVSWAAELEGRLLVHLEGGDGGSSSVLWVYPSGGGWSVEELGEVTIKLSRVFPVEGGLVGGALSGRVYRSSDGINWEAVLPGVLAGTAGSLSFASDSSGHLLMSSDGRKWNDTGLSGAYGVVGTRSGAAALGAGTVWVSPDFVDWEPIPADLDHGLAAGNGTLIPGTDQLLLLGANHGKVAVWEWMP